MIENRGDRKTPLLIVFVSLILLAPAPYALELALDTESRIWLEGNSTLHSYASTASVINGEFVLEGTHANWLSDARDGKLRQLTLAIPVSHMRSGKKGLDKKMRKTMKSKIHPAILFKLNHYEVEGISSDSNWSDIQAVGILALAGQEREIRLDASAQFGADQVRVKGDKTLLMTDFGMKPPKMFLGAIKTNNEVTVHFDLLLTKKKSEQANTKEE